MVGFQEMWLFQFHQFTAQYSHNVVLSSLPQIAMKPYYTVEPTTDVANSHEVLLVSTIALSDRCGL